MTQREKHRSAFLLIGWAMLCVCAAPAGADTILVSGQFGSGATADQFAAPDALWALSFTADSNPAAANLGCVRIDAPFSDFSYTMNGSPVTVSPGNISLLYIGGRRPVHHLLRA